MLDNVLIHAAHNVTKFFQGNKSCDLDVQALLPGLNPIEYTWQYIKNNR